MSESITPTFRDAYALQQDLAILDDRRRDLALELDREARSNPGLGSTTDWMRHPDYVAICATHDALAAKVAEAREAVGGVVYRVHEQNYEAVVKKLTTLRKRATKLGQSVAWIADPEPEHVEHRDGSVSTYHYLALAADPIKIAGWVFLAKLTVEEAGVLVAKAPAISRAWASYREGLTENGAMPEWGDRDDELTVAAQAYLDAINLGEYANPETARECDHCKLDRRRKASYLVEHLETGEIKQVGSSCLRDFLGTDPHNVLRYGEILAEVADVVGEGGSGTRLGTSTRWFLTNACTMIRTNGWAAKSGSSYPTAQQAADNVFYGREKKRDRKGNPLWVDVTDADGERADAAIEWADSYLGAKVNQSHDASDFDRNLYIAAKNSVVNDRTEGILAYLPIAHARYLEREIEFASSRAASAASEHVGTVGDRVPLTLTVEKVFENEGHYGVTFITTMRDADGNTFKWFGSYELDRGKRYSATWTIKKHDQYQGAKETVIARPAKLAPVDEAQQVLA